MQPLTLILFAARTVLGLACVTTPFLCSSGSATPPAGSSPDPAMAAWFESLHQPGSERPCCSISDCRFTAYTERLGHFEVEIEGWTYVVSAQAVLWEVRSP